MIQKSFDDVFGATHTEGVHKLVNCNLDMIKRTASAEFQSYHNKAAFDAGKPSLSGHMYVATSIENLDVNSWDELRTFMETVVITYDPFFIGGIIITE